MRLPSINTLREAFPEHAKELRAALEMSRRQLEATEAGGARVRECYHPPDTWDVRMEVLNAIAGTYGVEHAQTEAGEFASYLNTGDTYTPTIIYWQGRYRVQSLGDLVESLERNRHAQFI